MIKLDHETVLETPELPGEATPPPVEDASPKGIQDEPEPPAEGA